MKFKRLKKKSFLETCAASDLAFLLIIYFLIIAGFSINTGFLFDLPSKDSSVLILDKNHINFELNSEGKIFFKNEEIGISRAGTLINTALNYNPNIAVTLSIDRYTRWQNVVSFVELAQNLNIDSFSFSLKDKNP